MATFVIVSVIMVKRPASAEAGRKRRQVGKPAGTGATKNSPQAKIH
jgi:hypothetical protein